MQTIETYLKNLTPSQKAQHKRIKDIVQSMVPEVEETISYGIPTFKYKGKYILYFAAFKSHMSVYPVFEGMLSSLKDELGDFKLTKETLQSKGTVQFTEDNPVPEVLIRAVVSERLERIK